MSDLSLFDLPEHIETRWASAENPTGARQAAAAANFGRKGRPSEPLHAGSTFTLASADGPGMVRRIWITIDVRTPQTLRGIVLRMYWDGEEKPAVEAPLGDFFGLALGRTAAFEAAYFDSPEGRSFNCRFPMPFRSGMRITASNESPVDVNMFFYQVDYTLGDKHTESAGYFHAHFNRQNPTIRYEDFEILPKVTGRGRFLGTTVGAIGASKYWKTWWGEGEVKVYIDGDSDLPTLCGTGTEDYICTGWGQGMYGMQWYGCPIADMDRMEYSFYRLHGPDPVYFQREARVTIQQIGCYDKTQAMAMIDAGALDHFVPNGDGTKSLGKAEVQAGEEYQLFEREDDWSATAYFYLDSPTNSLPPIAAYADRVAGLQGDPAA